MLRSGNGMPPNFQRSFRIIQSAHIAAFLPPGTTAPLARMSVNRPRRAGLAYQEWRVAGATHQEALEAATAATQG